MLRRLILPALVALLCWCGIGRTQLTSSTVTDFGLIRQRDDNDIRMRVKLTNPYLMSDNRVGSLLATDTSFSHNATVDSIDAYAKGEDIHWVITVDGKSDTDSLVYLKVQEFLTDNGRLRLTKRDTLDYSSGAGMPGGGAFSDVNTFSLAPGFNLSVSSWATVNVGTSTWATFFYLKHEKFVTASDGGAIATLSLPALLDSLTVLAADSGVAGDRTFGTPIPGNYGYISLFIDANTHNSSTAATVQVLYQVKDNNGEWSGDIDAYGDSVFSLKDSVALDSSVQKGFRAVTISADSVRFGVQYLTIAGTVILNKLKALWRD